MKRRPRLIIIEHLDLFAPPRLRRFSCELRVHGLDILGEGATREDAIFAACCRALELSREEQNGKR